MKTIRIAWPGILLVAAACSPAALPLREDSSSAASIQAAEAPPPQLPPLSTPAWKPAPAAAPGVTPHEHAPQKAVTPTPAAVYTCGMHPEVRASQPGKCPACGMTLERLEEEP